MAASNVMRRMYRTADTLVLSPDSFNPEHGDIVVTADDNRQVMFGGGKWPGSSRSRR